MQAEDETGLVPGEMRPIVKTMALSDIAEDKALEVVEGALRQMLDQVAKNHNTTSKGAFNVFNAKRFLKDLDELKGYVEKQFGRD